MIGTRSWNEDYHGAEPQDKHKPERTAYFVEFWVSGSWELFAECEDQVMAADEVKILDERGFHWRVIDDDGVNVVEEVA